MVELELWAEMTGGAWEWTTTTWVVRYRCHFVVQARVDGLEDKLKAELKPVKVKKGFLRRETVGFRWEEKGLAQILNSDDTLRNMLYPTDKLALLNKWLIQLPNVEITPYRKHQCIRIWGKDSYYNTPEAAFPTIEALEAYDRIAQHIRSIANVRP